MADSFRTWRTINATCCILATYFFLHLISRRSPAKFLLCCLPPYELVMSSNSKVALG